MVQGAHGRFKFSKVSSVALFSSDFSSDLTLGKMKRRVFLLAGAYD